jgi:hypothetical protein
MPWTFYHEDTTKEAKMPYLYQSPLFINCLFGHFPPNHQIGVQVHKPTETGEWRLEPSSGVQALATHKRELTAALMEAKYDKIVHVRQAAVKALTELECIPDGMGLSSILPAESSHTDRYCTHNMHSQRGVV